MINKKYFFKEIDKSTVYIGDKFSMLVCPKLKKGPNISISLNKMYNLKH